MTKKRDDSSEEYLAPTNEKRADWAAEALTAVLPAASTKESGLSCEELIIDLLGDLLHLARREKLDPLRAVEWAVGHFVADEEAIGIGDPGPEVDVALVIIMDGESYHELGKRGRRRARRERVRRMDEEVAAADEGDGSLY